MPSRTPYLLLPPLAVVIVLAGCLEPAPGAMPEESQLPAAIHFSPADLSTRESPCVNLNTYVNGKWLAANPIPPEVSIWGAMAILADRSLAIQQQLAAQAGATTRATGVTKLVGDFWASGMDSARINAEGILPLQPWLAEIDALSDGPAIADFLRQSAARGMNDLFDFGAAPDFKNSAINIAYAVPTGLGLPERGYYFDTDKRDVLAAYGVHVARVLELSGVPAESAAARAADVVAFETALARVSRPPEVVARDMALEYNPVTLAAADSLTPNFSWTRFFEAQGVAAPEYFSLVNPPFFQAVSRALGDTDPAVWRAYLRFHTVDDAAPYLSDPFVREDFEFYGKTLGGEQEMSPRPNRVLGAIEAGAGEALGQMYVQATFPPAAKAQIEGLVRQVGLALRARIENVAWMSPETKEKALEKWAAFTAKVGYPDRWRDWNGLATSRETYLGNALSAQEFNYRWEVAKIGQPVDRGAWAITPQTVDAYYDPQRNEIVFPAAILQPPFFDPKADLAFNYGGIGAVIGHEMTHGYDDQGARFGPTGNFENWWTPADSQRFQARTSKLVTQFDQYQVASGAHVNGELTLGENIADLGGLATAYDALRRTTAGEQDPRVDGMSRDQNFFLNWATIWRSEVTPELQALLLSTDPHAPAQFRAIGPPSNLPAYAAAFGCQAGEPMVRSGAERVVIW